ncbi:hypothetical protein MMPV_006505 [Pyropia vietnamensis]
MAHVVNPPPRSRRPRLRSLLSCALAAAATSVALLMTTPFPAAAHVHLPTVISSPRVGKWMVPGVCFLPGEVPARAYRVVQVMQAYDFPRIATRRFQRLVAHWMNVYLRQVGEWKKRTTPAEAALLDDGYTCFVEEWEEAYVGEVFNHVVRLSGRDHWSDEQWAAALQRRARRGYPFPHPNPHQMNHQPSSASVASTDGALAQDGAGADVDAIATTAATVVAAVAAEVNVGPPRHGTPTDAPALAEPVSRVRDDGGVAAAVLSPTTVRSQGIICARCCIIFEWDGLSNAFRRCVKQQRCRRWRC